MIINVIEPTSPLQHGAYYSIRGNIKWENDEELVGFPYMVYVALTKDQTILRTQGRVGSGYPLDSLYTIIPWTSEAWSTYVLSPTMPGIWTLSVRVRDADFDTIAVITKSLTVS
jgi:hypothetical protein